MYNVSFSNVQDVNNKTITLYIKGLETVNKLLSRSDKQLTMQDFELSLVGDKTMTDLLMILGAK
jgi:hypothetical protein